MEPILAIVASALLVLSSAIAFGLASGTKGFTMRTPSGPDAMGIMLLFLANLLGWGLTLLAAWFAAGRGAFVWFVTPTPLACFLLLLITAGLAFISVLGLGASLEHDLKRRSLYGHLGALILPVSANAFVAFLAWSRPEFLAGSPVPRIVAIPFGLVAVGSLVTAGVIYVRAQGKAAERIARQIEENEQQQALNQADAIERDATHRAELDELADDTPLTTFVTHLFIDKSEAHHRLALARIGGLPDLAARFDAELRANPDPLAREYLLNYFEMAEPVDPGVLDALRPTIAWCFEQLAGDFEQALAQGRTEEVRHVGGMPMGLLLAARKFGQPRFVGGAARLRAVLKAWPESAGAEAVRALDDYLAEPTVG